MKDNIPILLVYISVVKHHKIIAMASGTLKVLLISIFLLVVMSGFAQKIQIVEINADTAYDTEDPIFVVVEESPSYVGGDEARLKFIKENIIYPEEARQKGIQGTVYVTFVIEKSGSLNDVKVLRGLGGGLDEEAVRVVKMMPPWQAGKQRGKFQRVQYNMPVKFTLPVDKQDAK